MEMKTSVLLLLVTVIPRVALGADEGGIIYRCSIPNYSRDIPTFTQDIMIKEGEWYVSPPGRYEWTAKGCGTTKERGAYEHVTKCTFRPQFFSNDFTLIRNSGFEVISSETIYLSNLKYVAHFREAPDFKDVKQEGSCRVLDN
jgi:hypothetical protein